MPAVWLWLATGCGGPAEPPAAPDPAPAPTADRAAEDPEAVALARAQATIDDARARLQSRMVQAMNHHAPPEDVVSCSIEAEALTEAAPEGSGASVGRSSLRLRNPDNAAPDWVRAWLDAQGERAAAGVDGIRRVDTVDGARVARVLAPIPIEPRCLGCHGPKDTLPADVRAALDQRYPDDHATGYAMGDLRGAMWAEVPVAPAASP